MLCQLMSLYHLSTRFFFCFQNCCLCYQSYSNYNSPIHFSFSRLLTRFALLVAFVSLILVHKILINFNFISHNVFLEDIIHFTKDTYVQISVQVVFMFLGMQSLMNLPSLFNFLLYTFSPISFFLFSSTCHFTFTSITFYSVTQSFSSLISFILYFHSCLFSFILIQCFFSFPHSLMQDLPQMFTQCLLYLSVVCSNLKFLWPQPMIFLLLHQLLIIRHLNMFNGVFPQRHNFMLFIKTKLGALCLLLHMLMTQL